MSPLKLLQNTQNKVHAPYHNMGLVRVQNTFLHGHRFMKTQHAKETHTMCIFMLWLLCHVMSSTSIYLYWSRKCHNWISICQIKIWACSHHKRPMFTSIFPKKKGFERLNNNNWQIPSYLVHLPWSNTLPINVFININFGIESLDPKIAIVCVIVHKNFYMLLIHTYSKIPWYSISIRVFLIIYGIEWIATPRLGVHGIAAPQSKTMSTKLRLTNYFWNHAPLLQNPQFFGKRTKREVHVIFEISIV